MSTTCCIIGLGWGRASRAVRLTEVAKPPFRTRPVVNLTTGALAAPSTEDGEPAGPTVRDLASRVTPDAEVSRVKSRSVRPIGEEDIEELTAESLFDPAATKLIVILWILTPSLSVVGSYLLFAFLL